MVPVTLEGKNGVNDVFEHSRAGQRPLLCDVTDQDHGDPPLLGHPHECVGALAYLSDAARSRTQLWVDHRLNRIDHHDARFDVVEMTENFREHRGGGEPQFFRQRAEPFGPKADLLQRFLPADEKGPSSPVGHRRQHLEEKGGLSNSWLASEDGHRAGNQAAAEHSIDLGIPGGTGGPLVEADFANWAGCFGRANGPTSGHRPEGNLKLLVKRIPRPA